MEEVSKTHNAIQYVLFPYCPLLQTWCVLGRQFDDFVLVFFSNRTLDKTISNLEMELAAAKAAQESILSGAPISEDMEKNDLTGRRRKYLMVIGINTAFSSRKRRDSVRATWMPQGLLANSLALYLQSPAFLYQLVLILE